MNARLPYAIAAALLFMAATASASDPVFQCTTNGGGWTVRASGPFEPVSCPVDQCTGMTYNITPHRGETPDHVAITVDWQPKIIIPPSTFDSAPCVGDNVSGLAFRDCANQVSRINQNQQKTGPFDLVVAGGLVPVDGSIVVKKGSKIEQCRIATLGREVFDPHAQVRTSETIAFKGCELTIPVDGVTGEPGVATVAGDGCIIVANGTPTDSVTLLINGVDVGSAKWIADGGVSTGDNSCTTRFVGGKPYTICDCKSIGDPRPPCP